ncbi:response regulator [Exilibacterium tricleocarpae]|uniref:Response regulator n=1 Tax=Exilibacterium tricleocarpae TaxID=2591008 RepID=A0A545U5L1_9GAMM|nr:tetratricopeptide repeat protein [Exilibacterium tricleocarpae]TQV84693.1 response regulator [Exilibacterium tricleocarpae]
MQQIDVIKIYSTKKCLIIDDFTEVRGSLKRMLKAFGASHIDTAASGRDAIHMCQARTYDIVLCDYNLGTGKDGQQILEELRYLRALTNTSLFVMITAESSRQMVLGALECQPDDYITKPITQASLRLRLDKALIKHQVFFDIKQAIDNRDYHRGLALCDQVMDGHRRYAADCLRIKAQLHYLLNQHEEAITLYRETLAEKPHTWAKLGLGKTLLATGELDEAEALLLAVIEEDTRYVEAHDLLAELYAARNDTLTAQAYTTQATEVSPRSVVRHRQLAALAEQNHDDDVCIGSHQNAIKWGLDSCHESAQDTFNYARKIAEVVNGDTSAEGRAKAKQAMKSLDRVVKRFAEDSAVALQAKLVETQVHASQKDTEAAAAAAAQAHALYEETEDPAIETSLDCARALLATGRHREAQILLVRLAREHPDDADLIAKIDALAQEPVSEPGKKLAGDLTRQGISQYEAKQYREAIDTFTEAIGLYPKHIGLNLNLVQVILAEAKARQNLGEYTSLYRRCLRQVTGIGANHPQFERFSYLQRQIKKLEAATTSDSSTTTAQLPE